MKTILLSIILLITISSNAQTFSTGLLPLIASSGSALNYSAKVDVDASKVTLTLIGASDRWLGIGFGTNSMTSGSDVVIFDGTNLTDRTFLGIGSTPTLDANQDWTIISNSINSGVRTVIGTRSLTTSDSSDYTFSPAASSLNLVYARGNSMTLGYHGYDGYGASTANLALNAASFESVTAKIFPNPSNGSFTIQCVESPQQINVYSHVGKLVKTINGDGSNSREVILENLPTGIYLVEIQINDKKSWNKIIIK